MFAFLRETGGALVPGVFPYKCLERLLYLELYISRVEIKLKWVVEKGEGRGWKRE